MPISAYEARRVMARYDEENDLPSCGPVVTWAENRLARKLVDLIAAHNNLAVKVLALEEEVRLLNL